MMKVATLSLLLCFAALALRAQAQDDIIFVPPSDFDKDAPPPDVTMAPPLPTELGDKDKTLPQDNGKEDPTTASRPPPTEPPRPDVTVEPRQPANAPIVPEENCTGVRCSLEVLSSCKHPVLLPGRCCPSCPNKTVCSDVCCGRGKICSEYENQAICCDVNKHYYNVHRRRQQLRKSLITVNEFGENCSLRYEQYEYVRVCNSGTCTKNETCYPRSKYYATCCARRSATKPTCIVSHPKVLGRCTVPPPRDDQRKCICRVVMTLPFGYYGYLGYGHHRGRRSFGYHGYHNRGIHHCDQDSTFITYMTSQDRSRCYLVSCHGPTDVCQAKLRGRRRSRRSLGYLLSGLLRHVKSSFKRLRNRYSLMCRNVRV